MATDNRKPLTDAVVRNAPVPPSGKREVIWDSYVDGFGLRITDKGARSFFVMKRPRGGEPIRLTIGQYPADAKIADRHKAISDARATAKEHLTEIAAGRDPREAKAERRRAKEAEQEAHAAQAERDADAVAATSLIKDLVETYKAEVLDKQRQGENVYNALVYDLVAKHGERAAADVSESDVVALIMDIKARGALTAAKQGLGYVRRFFEWAAGQKTRNGMARFGFAESPCEAVKAKALFTKQERRNRKRQHRLSDDALWAFWRVTSRWGFPLGTGYQTVAIHGTRLNESARVDLAEFNFHKKDGEGGAAPEWVIPAARMKGISDEEALPHLIPLTPFAMQVLSAVPHLMRKASGKAFPSQRKKGAARHLGSKPKNRLDAEMLIELRALAVARGVDPATVDLPHWVHHDLRRNMRSAMSALKVPFQIAELCIAHKKTGVNETYDLYEFADEKREAFEKWHGWLARIISERDAIMEARAAA